MKYPEKVPGIIRAHDGMTLHEWAAGIDQALNDAYAEGRKDEAEARAPSFLKALDLIEEAMFLANGVWSDELKKDERDGLSFNLRYRIKEFLEEIQK